MLIGVVWLLYLKPKIERKVINLDRIYVPNYQKRDFLPVFCIFENRWLLAFLPKKGYIIFYSLPTSLILSSGLFDLLYVWHSSATHYRAYHHINNS